MTVRTIKKIGFENQKMCVHCEQSLSVRVYMQNQPLNEIQSKKSIHNEDTSLTWNDSEFQAGGTEEFTLHSYC